MNFYIAASYPLKIQACFLAGKIRENGHKIASTWHDDWEQLIDDPEKWGEDCIRDFSGVRDCNHFVQLTGDNQSKGGRHTELGIALALGKRISLIGPNEQVFHRHPSITHYARVRDFIERLPTAKLF